MKKSPRSSPKPPKAYKAFIKRFPALAQSWESISAAGRKGPLDEKSVRLVKFALAVGAQQEGAAHSSVRKAAAMGISRAELEQVVALAAGTIGMPRVVASWCWVNDELGAD